MLKSFQNYETLIKKYEDFRKLPTTNVFSQDMLATLMALKKRLGDKAWADEC